jgi:hypothetical protein
MHVRFASAEVWSVAGVCAATVASTSLDSDT